MGACESSNSPWAVGDGVEDEVRVGGLERDFRAGDGAVLRIVHDAVHRCEDGGEGREGCSEQASMPKVNDKKIDA